MKRLVATSAIMSLALAFVPAALGDIFTYTSRAAWEAALAGGASDWTETFDGYGGQSYDATPITTSNLTVTSATNNPNNVISTGPMTTPGPHMFAWLRAEVPNVDSFLTFNGPLSAWGADMRIVNAARVTFLDENGASLGTFQPNTNAGATELFFGVIATSFEQISQVNFATGITTFGTVNYFDNISGKAWVAIPEPTSLVLIVGLSLCGIPFCRRRP